MQSINVGGIVIGRHYSDTEPYIEKHGMDMMIETVKQMDHVVIDQWHQSNLLDVRSYRSANHM
jgi:hypothetical protein